MDRYEHTHRRQTGTRLSMRLALTLVALVGIGLSGCARYSAVRPIVLGPYSEGETSRLFERVSAAAQSQGYQAVQADAGRGILIVQANTPSRYGASMFALQCYREGWVRIVPSGGPVRPVADRFVVPEALRPELESFAVRLRESLGGGAR